MHGPAQPSPRSQIDVTLDGKPVEVTSTRNLTLTAVRASLETLALKDKRILFLLRVDGKVMNLADSFETTQQFKKVEAVSIGFSEMGKHLVGLAALQTDRLRSRVEAMALVVMINEFSVVQRLWWDLIPDLKTPMATLNFLPDILEKSRNGPSIENLEPFIESIGELRLVLLDLDEAINRRSVFEFSEGLDKRLAPWLRGMVRFLEHLYDLQHPPK